MGLSVRSVSVEVSVVAILRRRVLRDMLRASDLSMQMVIACRSCQPLGFDEPPSVRRYRSKVFGRTGVSTWMRMCIAAGM